MDYLTSFACLTAKINFITLHGLEGGRDDFKEKIS